jgi:hypothetical protein
MGINAEAEQRRSEERMLAIVPITPKFRLNTAFDLKCFWANDNAAIRNSRPIGVY